MAQPPRILIVSDAPIADSMRVALEQRGFSVMTAPDCAQAFSRLAATPFDLLVVDVAETAEVIELIKRVRTAPELSKSLILMIAEWGTGQPTLGLSQGADAFEPRPVTEARLVAAVERLLHRELVMAQ